MNRRDKAPGDLLEDLAQSVETDIQISNSPIVIAASNDDLHQILSRALPSERLNFRNEISLERVRELVWEIHPRCIIADCTRDDRWPASVASFFDEIAEKCPVVLLVKNQREALEFRQRLKNIFDIFPYFVVKDKRFIFIIRSLELRKEIVSEHYNINDEISKYQERKEIAINCAIYLNDESLERANELYSLTKKFMSELGYVLQETHEWKRGSWYRRFGFLIQRLINQKMVKDRVKIAEDVIFHHKSLDASIRISEATVNLIASLKDQKGTVAIDAGLFLFIKITGENGDPDIFAKRLSVGERAILDSDPDQLRRPVELLEAIKGAKKVDGVGGIAAA